MSNLKIDERTQAIVNAFRESAVVEDDIIVFGDSVFENTLPEGYSMDDVNVLEQHRADVMNAATLVGGELSASRFAEDPDLQTISGGVVMGEKTRGVFTAVRETLLNDETVYSSPRFVVQHSLPDNDATSLKIRDHIHRLGKELLSE